MPNRGVRPVETGTRAGRPWLLLQAAGPPTPGAGTGWTTYD
jgi:hypothetical protein